jgi:hypothetical protein
MVEGSFLKYPKLLWSNTYTTYLEYKPIEDPLLKQLNNESNLKHHPPPSLQLIEISWSFNHIPSNGGLGSGQKYFISKAHKWALIDLEVRN